MCVVRAVSFCVIGYMLGVAIVLLHACVSGCRRCALFLVRVVFLVVCVLMLFCMFATSVMYLLTSLFVVRACVRARHQQTPYHQT